MFLTNYSLMTQGKSKASPVENGKMTSLFSNFSIACHL